MIGQFDQRTEVREKGSVSRSERLHHEAFQVIMREIRANETVYAVVTPVMNGAVQFPPQKDLR